MPFRVSTQGNDSDRDRYIDLIQSCNNMGYPNRGRQCLYKGRTLVSVPLASAVSSCNGYEVVSSLVASFYFALFTPQAPLTWRRMISVVSPRIRVPEK